MSIKVKLRKKAISGNRHSLYLDFYPEVPHPKTGEPTRRQFLGYYLFDEAKSLSDKAHNKETLQRAEQIRQQKDIALNKPDSSRIIGLKRENGLIKTVDLPKEIDTYGWSSDDVLYKVFGVRTTRNYYMEVDMRELLHSISEKKDNKSELEIIINRLENVKLNDEDPLVLIIRKAKEYISKI